MRVFVYDEDQATADPAGAQFSYDTEKRALCCYPGDADHAQVVAAMEEALAFLTGTRRPLVERA